MKAVRIHGYHQQPVVDEVPEPSVKGPLDVVVKIGGAGVCRTDLHIIDDGLLVIAMYPDGLHCLPPRLDLLFRIGAAACRGRCRRSPRC